MDHEQVGRYWDENAEVWTELVRAGYDHYRDGLNTPAFLAMLPNVEGLSGLDVGCGEGHNTRLLAERGARMVGIDVSKNFVRYAKEAEGGHRPGVRYEVASAVELPFGEASFD
ncbi:MAG: class I SAM-dependent methyltransferase, partial [Rubrobacter sp.]